MTGFANREGAGHGWTWSWEIRGVNGRSLDIRIRFPEQPDGLEAAMRATIQKHVKRGNITVSLRLTRDETTALGQLNHDALTETLVLLREVEAAAGTVGMALAPTSAADILSTRGVLDQKGTGGNIDELRAALLSDIEPLVNDYDSMRAGEGAALSEVIAGQINEVERLTSEAEGMLADRAEHVSGAFRVALTKVVDNTDAVDEDRIAQELAVLAVKSDVTEELDRLKAHISAAKELLADDGPKGRKFEFLLQEFNREANTLCSKAQFSDLTRIGLDLKHSIDQMREQIQNVE